MVVDKNCPTCQYNNETNVCDRRRQRINKNEKGEFVKNVVCPFWAFRTKPKDRTVNICPTCGRPYTEEPGPEIVNIERSVTVFTNPEPKPESTSVDLEQSPPAKTTSVDLEDVPDFVVPMSAPEQFPQPEPKKRGRPRKRSPKIFTDGRTGKSRKE